MKLSKKMSLPTIALIAALFCTAEKAKAQDFRYVKDLETGKNYYTPVERRSDGAFTFLSDPQFETSETIDDPTDFRIDRGPRETVSVRVILYDREITIRQTICFNQNIWPCALCANSLGGTSSAGN